MDADYYRRTYWVVVAESIRLCSYDLLENKNNFICVLTAAPINYYDYDYYFENIYIFNNTYALSIWDLM